MQLKTLMRYMIYFLTAIILFGCSGGTKVVLKQESYVPSFRGADYRFKGKTVILDNFTNQAANTKQWGYFSADSKFYYEATTHLESYLWDCFRKAFQHAGIKVFDHSYGYGVYPYHHWWGGAPYRPRPQGGLRDAVEFQVVLMSMTDQECKFQVLLFKKGEQKFQKDYNVTMPTLASLDPKERERNAYLLIDQMVTTVFKDREFRKAF